jgi:hypothetical protein
MFGSPQGLPPQVVTKRLMTTSASDLLDYK